MRSPCNTHAVMFSPHGSISVIIPIFNAEKSLSKCIESVISQTYTYIEILLIDDGSTDKSGDICDKFALKDNRVKVIHKSNGGVSSARNAGLDISRGEWIVFVDSDDWCENNYLSDFFSTKESLLANEIVLQGRKNEVNGIVTHSTVLKNAIYTNIAEGVLDNQLLTFGAPYCKLYSNKLIKEHNIRFPENYSYGEDTTFFLRNLSYVNKIATISRCNYHYVEAESGSLSKKDHDFKPLSEFLMDSLNLISEIDLKSCAHGALISAYMPNYKNLILRSIANMYRLKYGREQMNSCFKAVKNILIPNYPIPKGFVLSFIKHTPIWLLIPTFQLQLKLHK